MIKKVLIMSASTGGGHNRAARAIKEELESRTIDNMSIECEIVDSLKLVNNTMDKVISRGYEKSALYTPKAYGSVYRFSETTIASKNEFKTNPLTSLMARKFKHLLNDLYLKYPQAKSNLLTSLTNEENTMLWKKTPRKK